LSKRLTVIIPGCNNPEKWWSRCIESVLRNIGDNDEIICVDDCSEHKPTVLDEYSLKDKRIRTLYRNVKGGPSAARNSALKVAAGKYLTFIDSDDELLPDAYSKAIEHLEQGCDIACFGVRSIWVNERLYKDNIPVTADSGVLRVDGVKRFLDNTLMYYVWNKVYRKEFLEVNGLSFNEGMEMGEDLDFILRCVESGASWSMLDYLGIKYYKTHRSILSRYKPSYVNGLRKTMEMWMEYKARYDEQSLLGSFGEMTEKEIWEGEWDNIWRLASPYGLKDKWYFLSEHSEIVKGTKLFFYVKKVVYSFFRKYFYLPPIQRFHIRRVYPDVRPLSEIEGS